MDIVSFFTDLGEGIYDTITGGRGTTKESAEDIEKASQQYKQQMEDIAKNTKSAKELYQEGKETASAQANNKAGLAMKNAKAAAMQQSGSKLLSAIQGAEAANKATQEGYDTAATNAANLGANIQSEKNAALQTGAKAAYEGAESAAKLRAEQAIRQSEANKNATSNIMGAFLKGLDKGE